jgi:hypothetical protein
VLPGDALRSYFDVDTLGAAVGLDGNRGKQDVDLWPILNFALWHRYWIEGQPLEGMIEPVVASAA